MRRRFEHAPQFRLATELRDIRLGDPVAENEEDTLSTYFLATAAFQQVLASRATVFVGRKGSGKTANLLQAVEALRRDARNLVCVIKPIWYEWSSLTRLLTDYERRDSKGYMMQSLWKLLIYTEIARNAVEELAHRGPSVPRTDDEQAFVDFVDGPGRFVRGDFAVRLEDAVDRLLSGLAAEGIATQRVAISEALHNGDLRILREHLGRLLAARDRVSILIDNLDKGWVPGAALDSLATFLLGLLTSITDIASEFSRRDHRWREPVNVTLAVFLRSDIFAHVQRIAAEPDKIPVSRLTWANDESLAHVVEERFVVARGGTATGSELWSKFFAEEVDGRTTRDYIISRVLPRPRDMIVLTSAAIGSAIDRGHGRVESDDVLRGEAAYSRFAFDAIQAEDGGPDVRLEDVLFELAGQSSCVTGDSLQLACSRAGVSSDALPGVIVRLVQLGVLGVETVLGEFAYTDDERELQRNQALADRLARESDHPRRYQVHPAFRSFLEMVE